jgi:formylglycine-generating enzyme required for sulfatase activity
LGSDAHYPEERPAREVTVADLSIARTPTTVAQFAAFVDATGYRTRAERDLGGSAVFTPPSHPVDLRDPRQWWSWVEGASWLCPTGPGSRAGSDHPVTHVVLADALAYCAWAGLRLPDEKEWEHAARGGLDGATYAWGDERGAVPAVVFRGKFPWRSSGRAGTAPIGTCAPNGYGLLDVTGNVWELVDTAWSPQHPAASCCAPTPATGTAVGVAKGGSFLCSDDYCSRYRPAARIPVAADSPTANVGFRCAGPRARA